MSKRIALREKIDRILELVVTDFKFQDAGLAEKFRYRNQILQAIKEAGWKDPEDCHECGSQYQIEKTIKKATNEIRELKDAEFAIEKVEFGLSVNEAAYELGKAECQARVERIFKEIEEQFFTYDSDDNLILCSAMNSDRKVKWWQEFWKQKGIND